MWKITSTFLLVFGLALLQVQAQTEEPTNSFEGSGTDSMTTLLSDDEDLNELWSGSGVPPEEENTSDIETKSNNTPDYEDEPEIGAPEMSEENMPTEEELEKEEEEAEEEMVNEETDEEEMENEILEEEIEEEEANFEDEIIDEIETEEDSEMDSDADMEVNPETTTQTTLTTTTLAVPEPDDKNGDKEEDEIDVETDLKEKDPDVDKTASAASIFGNNQFLAAIIIGGCIGLLFAVCVIFLLVYRLKKKDEGSYALDEQKKPSSTSYQYTQGQEYFA